MESDTCREMGKKNGGSVFGIFGIFLPREKARTEAIKKSPASLGFHQKEKKPGGGCCNSIRGTDEGGEIGVGAMFENRA